MTARLVSQGPCLVACQSGRCAYNPAQLGVGFSLPLRNAAHVGRGVVKAALLDGLGDEGWSALGPFRHPLTQRWQELSRFRIGEKIELSLVRPEIAHDLGKVA